MTGKTLFAVFILSVLLFSNQTEANPKKTLCVQYQLTASGYLDIKTRFINEALGSLLVDLAWIIKDFQADLVSYGKLEAKSNWQLSNSNDSELTTFADGLRANLVKLGIANQNNKCSKDDQIIKVEIELSNATPQEVDKTVPKKTDEGRYFWYHVTIKSGGPIGYDIKSVEKKFDVTLCKSVTKEDEIVDEDGDTDQKTHFDCENNQPFTHYSYWGKFKLGRQRFLAMASNAIYPLFRYLKMRMMPLLFCTEHQHCAPGFSCRSNLCQRVRQ